MPDQEHFTVRPSAAPVTAAVSKVGGQPVWLERPQWPLSRDTGKPMWFIAQFQVPAGLAYLFLTDATDHVDYAAEPDGGENAVIVQRGGRLPMLQRSVREEHRPVPVTATRTGPTVAPEDHVLVRSTEPDSFQFTGGEPRWLQGPDVPGAGYRFVAQLDAGALPFPVNFGDGGTGFVFVSADGLEGRFLWQNN